MTTTERTMIPRILLAPLFVAFAAFTLVAAEAPKVFEALQPSIVLISNDEGIGSGVVISNDGMILTNLHVANSPLPFSVKATVLQGGKRIEKTFEGLQLQKAHKSDDLALIKINAPEFQFLPAKLSKSPADSKTGAICFALGYPYLPNQTRSDLTITQGMINSTSREIEGKTYLQTDVAIMPGNSGGALVNANGIVVGIPTLRYEGQQRVGLAIPANGIRMQDFSDPAMRKGDVAEADRLSRMAQAYLRSDLYSDNGDPASASMALQLFRESLSADPKNAERWFVVAEAYRHFGVFEPARAYAENAVKLNPNNVTYRFTLANICENLKDIDKAITQYFACIPLFDSKTTDFAKSQALQRLQALLKERKDAMRMLYLISWSKVILGKDVSIDEQLQLKRLSAVIPPDQVQAIMSKQNDHSIAEMEKLASKYPQLIPDLPSTKMPSADASKVKEVTIEIPVIVSKISFPQGDSAELADAPKGVVYKADQGVVEWTPEPFTKKEEIFILFLIKHADGTESTKVHTIKRNP